MRALVADSEPASRFVVLSTLVALGRQVEQAGSRAELRAVMAQTPCDVVITRRGDAEFDVAAVREAAPGRDAADIFVLVLADTALSERDYADARRAGVDDLVPVSARPADLGHHLDTAERVLADRRRVRALEGLLPVCRCCHKVRNDAGYWQEGHEYLEGETTARTGICPDCRATNAIIPLESPAPAAATAAPDLRPRPTLKTIAERLGISTAAVSMALRNSSRISTAVRSRVAAVAQELGYRPDPEMNKVMRRMRVQQKVGFKSVIYALAPSLDETDQPFARALIRGCEAAAAERGYSFALWHVHPDEDPRRMDRILRSRGVEGVLLLPNVAVDGTHALDWDRYSVIAAATAGTGQPVPAFDAVRPHWYGAVLCAYHELAGRECRRVGAVLNHHFDRWCDSRVSAAIHWLNHCGSGGVPPYVFSGHGAASARDGGPGGRNEPPGFAPADFRAWYQREQPDGLVFDTEPWATAALRELGAAAPPVARVAILDRPDESEFGGVVQRPHDIGVAAVELLATKIERGVRGRPSAPSIVKVMGHWKAPRPNRRDLAPETLAG